MADVDSKAAEKAKKVAAAKKKVKICIKMIFI